MMTAEMRKPVLYSNYAHWHNACSDNGRQPATADRRSMMKRQTIDTNGFVTFDVERSSRRVQNGVEIIERETQRSIRFEDNAYINSKPVSATQLVVSDAINKSKLFISKSRSQLGEIDSFIRNIARRTVEAK